MVIEQTDPDMLYVRITIQLSFMVAGPIRIIRPTLPGIPHSRRRTHRDWARIRRRLGALGDRVREETTRAAALTGTSTTSTSTDPG